MDRLVCGDVGFGKTEVAVRAAFKAVQDGKQAAVLVPTTLLASQHAQTFADRFAGFPVRVELLCRFLSPAQARKVVAGLADGHGRRGDRHPPAAGRRHHLQEPGPAGGRRGAALRGDPQRGGQAHRRRGRRADPHGQPHPPDPGDGPHRHPRPLHGQHAAGRPPARSSPTWASTTRRRCPRPSGGSCCARARSSSCTTGCRTSTRWPGRLRRARPRGPGGRRPRPDGRGHPRAGRARLLGAAATTCSCARPSSSRASTCPR